MFISTFESRKDLLHVKEPHRCTVTILYSGSCFYLFIDNILRYWSISVLTQTRNVRKRLGILVCRCHL